MNKRKSEAGEKLYQQALRIREGTARGLWLPKIWTLALRGDPDAMVDLADWFAGDAHHLGSVADGFSAAGLYRRAYCNGNARGAHNLAMTYFNRNDLQRYRHWLRKAGRAGDEPSRCQATRFETRLPHEAAGKIRRRRPEQKRDKFA
jgi:hypothetical protein